MEKADGGSAANGRGGGGVWVSQFVRLCRGWDGGCGHVGWEGTGGGGSLRGEETGQRAREPGWGRFGCPKGSRIGAGSSSGESDPDPPLSPPEQRRQGSTEGSPAGPGGGPWDWKELSLGILPLSRP
ncbi:hypothetical protein HJG60_008792 [Phyllostomus discolor]|uniref:Uncharacterized protein n=1 Tax=Phyllostomus discolor TaxID=89673 RepID=A0A833YWA5_9CHIR|nr:hypothetical protein HJG60_008792 [Phyllostomus discolor]